MDNTYPNLAAFRFLGLDMATEKVPGQAVANCPFCDKENKWYCSLDTGLWDCKVCGERGNPLTFLRLLHTESEKATTNADHDALAKERRLLWPDTLLQWGVAKSILTGEWLVPGYAPDGKLWMLYRRTQLRKKDGTWFWTLLPTPGVHDASKAHGLHGVPLLDAGRQGRLVCEGVWDAMALWEVVRQSSPWQGSMDVVAVPGCGIWQQSWSPLLAGGDVSLLYDSDHPPRLAKGRLGKSAGWAGAERAAKLLARAPERPASIKVLRWGPDGFAPEKRSGWDVRDHLRQGATLADRQNLVAELMGMVGPLPDEWAAAKAAKGEKKPVGGIEFVPCSSWAEVVDAWRPAMRWTDDLENFLAVTFAVTLSTKCIGDQLWIMAISPPSSGKTTIVEGFATCAKYVHAADTLTSLVSGFQTDPDGSENHSLLERINGKLFIVKDADPLLKEANRDKILSQFRAAYDRSLRTNFGNRMSKNWESLATSVVICGTESVHELDSSEMGARYLVWQVIREMDDDLEDEILDQVGWKADRNARVLSDGKPETFHSPELVKAMQLTGGYVAHLRENAERLLATVEVGDDAHQRQKDLARFVVKMRARPSSLQEEACGVEKPFRVMSQLRRLSICLAAVLGKEEVDAGVMALVRQCALDTSHGKSLAYARVLFRAGPSGLQTESVAIWVSELVPKARAYLQYLRKIGVVTVVGSGYQPRPAWTLTPAVARLWATVLQSEDATAWEGVI